MTVPFVLSWSLLEAMATGCMVIASDTAPVREVMRDGQEGLLVDFFAPGDLAGRMLQVLEGDARMPAIRAAARATVNARFALKSLLPRHLALLEETAHRAG
jgi:glycosyltransferase involved in cell wall biosynthesis